MAHAGGETAKAQAFQAFWDAGAPLVGDEGGQGWAAWEATQGVTPGKGTRGTPIGNGTAGMPVGYTCLLVHTKGFSKT